MKLKRLSIGQKALLVFLALVSLLTLSFIHLLQKAYEERLVDEGENIAEEILIVMNWASEFGGVWTMNKYSLDADYLMEVESSNGILKAYNGQEEVLDNLSSVHFYFHNPALITREIAHLSNIKYGWRFRAVSERYLLKEYKPDPWEAKAISTLKKEVASGKDEYWEWEGDKFRFAKAIKIKKTCLKCHGKPEELDPMFYKAMVAKYGEDAVKRLTGYKVGEVRGIVSVTILPPSVISTAVSLTDFWNIGALILAFLIFWYFAKNEVITPVERLTKAARDISLGKLDVDLGVRGIKEEEVKDEITKLAIAIDRLRASIRIAMERLRKKR